MIPFISIVPLEQGRGKRAYPMTGDRIELRRRWWQLGSNMGVPSAESTHLKRTVQSQEEGDDRNRPWITIIEQMQTRFSFSFDRSVDWRRWWCRNANPQCRDRIWQGWITAQMINYWTSKDQWIGMKTALNNQTAPPVKSTDTEKKLGWIDWVKPRDIWWGVLVIDSSRIIVVTCCCWVKLYVSKVKQVTSTLKNPADDHPALLVAAASLRKTRGTISGQKFATLQLKRRLLWRMSYEPWLVVKKSVRRSLF